MRSGKELVEDQFGWMGSTWGPPGSLPDCPLEFYSGTPGEVEGPRVSRSPLLFCQPRPAVLESGFLFLLSCTSINLEEKYPSLGLDEKCLKKDVEGKSHWVWRLL